MYRSAGENCRRKESVLSAWKMRGTRKSSAGFLQHLMRCIILAGCRMKHERVWQLSGRGQEGKPDYGETGEGTCTEPDGYHQWHGDGD